MVSFLHFIVTCFFFFFFQAEDGIRDVAVTGVQTCALPIFPLKHAGLALAIGLGACLNAGLLYRKLREYGIYHPQAGWRVFTLKVAVALATMAVVLWLPRGPQRWLSRASGCARGAPGAGHLR